MEKEVYAATGRRKASVARATIVPGDGSFTVNGRELVAHLCRDPLAAHAKGPLVAADLA